MRHVLVLLLVACLAGCGGVAVPSAPLSAVSGVTRSAEQNGRFIALVGPRQQHAEPFLGVPATNFDVLRSWVDTRTGEAVHQLYVEDSYAGAERNWNAARDGNGEPLRFVAISKNEITCQTGCAYAEEFAATLPEALLRASGQGLVVTFTGQSGAEKTIVVPGDLIAQQLAAVEATRATLPRAAAAAAPRKWGDALASGPAIGIVRGFPLPAAGFGSAGSTRSAPVG